MSAASAASAAGGGKKRPREQLLEYEPGLRAAARAVQLQAALGATGQCCAPLIDPHAHTHARGCAQTPASCTCGAGGGWIWAECAAARALQAGADANPGKWLVHSSRAAVDGTWATLKSLLARGQLGWCIKAATAAGTEAGGHMICVYTADGDNVEDVMRVCCALRDSGVVPYGLLNYKLDADTAAGVYASSAAAQRAGVADAQPKAHPQQLVSTYTSLAKPKEVDATEWRVELRRNNIGPAFEREVVASRAPPPRARALTAATAASGAAAAEAIDVEDDSS